jgi:cytochrome c5
VRAALALILGCGPEAAREKANAPAESGPPAEDSAEACESPETWATIGQPFLLTYCTACHSSHLSGEARYGAPEGVDLDSLAGARSWLPRVQARALDLEDMPPGDGPSTEERERLAAWIACGGPGEEAELPVGAAPDLGDGYLVMVEAEDYGYIDDGILLTRTIEGAGLDGREGVYSYEWYGLRPEGAWYWGYRLLDASGEVLRQVYYEPPIALVGGASLGPQALEAEILEGGETRFEAQTWTVRSGPAEEVDGRSLDAAPEEITAEEEGGERHTWQISEEDLQTRREIWLNDSRWVWQKQTVDMPATTDNALPWEAGLRSLERVVREEAP